MAGRRTTHFRGHKTRRLTAWFSLDANAQLLTGAGSEALSQSLNATALAARPFTVIRFRGIIGISSDQGVAGEDQSAALGVAVVSDQASAIGITAVPSPISDRGSDLFFVYEDMVASMFVASNSGVIPNLMTSRQFDSKAMRKVNEDEDVVITKGTTALSDGVILYTAGRLLVKLH